MRLSFSVGVKVPSSLVNIFKELKQDLGCTIPSHSILEKLAVQVTIDMENIFCFNFLFTKIGQMVLKCRLSKIAIRECGL
jgi:uracil DNA glycosylase